MKRIASTIFISYIYLLICPLLSQESPNIQTEFSIGQSFYSSNQDSALMHYKNAYHMAVNEKDTLYIIKILTRMGSLNFFELNNLDALEQLNEALYLAEEKNYLFQKANILNNLSGLNYRFGKNEIGWQLMMQSLAIKKELLAQGELEKKDLISTYNELVKLTRMAQKYRLAEAYLDTCYMYASTTDDRSDIQNGYLDVEKAGLLVIRKHYDAALDILYPLEQFYIQEIYRNGYNINTSILSFVQSNIGKVMFEKGNTDKALEYYAKALSTNKEHNMHHANQAFLYQTIARIYAQKGDYASAYNNLLEAKRLNDRLFKISNKHNTSAITLSNSYREALKKKQLELSAQELELAEQQRAIFHFRTFVGLIVLLTIIAIILVRNRVQNLHFKNKQLLTQQQAEERQRNAEQMLTTKNKELTSYTLQLIERDDLLDKFCEHLKNKDKSPAAKSLLISRKQLDGNNWEEFNQRFVSVNRGFYERLQEKYPDLTPTDLKHCALIKLNFSGKEMANLLGISEKSVHMARYRIRKKLKLDTEVNLSMFLGEV